MVTSKSVEAQILRYYHAQTQKIGTIATRTGVHYAVVRRVVAQAGLPCAKAFPRSFWIEAYLPFIQETLSNFPAMSASRLYALARQHGYLGSPDHFRHLIACVRPPFDISEWMLSILQNTIDIEQLRPNQ